MNAQEHTDLFEKEIPGFSGYFIDKLGNVYSEWKSGGVRVHGQRKKLALQQDKKGYLRTRIRPTSGGKLRAVKVHRLMCIAWYGDQPEMQVRHLDGDKGNNALGNLLWGTNSENQRDRFDLHGGEASKGERHGMSKLSSSDIDAIRKSDMASEKLGPLYGVSGRQIRKIRTMKAWSHLD